MMTAGLGMEWLLVCQASQSRHTWVMAAQRSSCACDAISFTCCAFPWQMQAASYKAPDRFKAPTLHTLLHAFRMDDPLP
jgi:hypothetical protein